MDDHLTTEVMNVLGMKIALDELQPMLPMMARLTKMIYTSYKDEGFSDSQSFDMAMKFTLQTIIKQ